MAARRPILVVLVLSVAVIFSMAFAADAQQQRPTCPMVVSDALTALGTNCANLNRNTSCYGHERVQHTSFVPSVPADFYTHTGDRSDLLQTETIQTGPFNLAQEIWGLNIMNVDANLPFAFSPKGVVYVQFGGVEVENGVQPDDAVKLVAGINVSTTGDTSLLSWPAPSVPGHASESVADIPSGESLSVDAINPAGNFLRAVYGDKVGWVSMSAVNTTGVDLSGLPTIGEEDMTPMQNFYFRTGIGGTNCVEAPSLLFVQGPNTTPVDIQVFKEPIRIESSIILRSLPPGDQLGNQLELVVLSGLAKLYPDTPNEIIVPPGFKATIPLCPVFASLGIEGDADEKGTCGSWSAPLPLTADELGICATVQTIPVNTINYPIGCPVIVPASGVGRVIPQLFFPNQAALDAATAACASGELPLEICQYLGIV